MLGSVASFFWSSPATTNDANLNDMSQVEKDSFLDSPRSLHDRNGSLNVPHGNEIVLPVLPPLINTTEVCSFVGFKSLLLDPNSKILTQGPWQSYEDFIEQLAKCPSEFIEEMNLDYIDDELLQMVGKSCPNLKILRIKPRLDNDSEMSAIKISHKGLDALKGLSRLEYFEWKLWHAIFDAENGFIDLILHLPHLKTLKLSHPYVTDKVLQAIGQCNQLSILHLQTSFTTSEGYIQMLQSPTLQRSLLELDLDIETNSWYTKYSDTFIQALLSLSSLHCLHLNFQVVRPHFSATALAEMLEKHKTLQSLSLGGFDFANELSEQISSMEDLKQLRLMDCLYFKIHDFVNLLKNKEKLQHLALYKLWLRSDGDVLFETIGRLPALKELHLTDIPFLTTGFGALAASRSRQLEKLSISSASCFPVAQWHELAKIANLTTLKIYASAGFNIEAFAAFIQGPSSQTILRLELDGLQSIEMSEKFISMIKQLSQLKHLLLGLYSWQDHSFKKLIDDDFLRENLVTLCLDEISTMDEDWSPVEKYKKLKAVVLLPGVVNQSDVLYQLAQKRGWQISHLKSGWPTIERKIFGETLALFDQVVNAETHF
jgi:hypothetical protein